MHVSRGLIDAQCVTVGTAIATTKHLASMRQYTDVGGFSAACLPQAALTCSLPPPEHPGLSAASHAGLPTFLQQGAYNFLQTHTTWLHALTQL